MTNTAKYTILSVDDDPEWTDFIAAVTGDDYLLKSAACADDIVGLAREIKPSVIILDVMMQGHKDGFTAFSELQRDPDCKHIPVIIFSEVNVITNLDFGIAGIEEYVGGRPTAFLEKPANPAKFLEAVRAAIQDSERRE